MSCDCGCGAYDGCYRPPAKCYVCYPKIDTFTCDQISQAFKDAIGVDQAKKWIELYTQCYGKCPPSEDALKEYIKNATSKMLGIGCEEPDIWRYQYGSYVFNRSNNNPCASKTRCFDPCV